MTEQTDEQGSTPFGQIVGIALVAVAVIAITAVAVAVGVHVVDQRNRDREAATAAALAAESTVDVSVKEWSVTAKPTAPAGDVTFTVTNNGTMDHELIVLHTDVLAADLPVDNAGDPPAPVTSGADKISEDTKIAETGDPNLAPGETRTFTVANMAPGHYVLVCNLAGHFTNGMYMDFTVVG